MTKHVMFTTINIVYCPLPTHIKDTAAIAENRAGTQMEYSGSNLSRLTDAMGNVTSYTYNNQGKMISSTDAQGQTVNYVYDDFGHKIQEIHKFTTLNGRVETQSNSWRYDQKGRVYAETINGVNTDTAWNDRDQKTGQRVGWSGPSTQYRYDANGKLIQTTAPDGSVTFTEYDLEGNVIADIDPCGQLLHPPKTDRFRTPAFNLYES